MVIIFSKKEIAGLAGTYASPLLFDGKFGGATLVITKHENIKKEALRQGIKVRGFEGVAIEAPKDEPKPDLGPLTLIEPKQPPAIVEAPVEPKPAAEVVKPKRTRKPRAKKAE